MKRTFILSILFCQLLVCMARNVVTISGQNDWLFRLATGSEEADSLVRVGFYEPSFRASGFTHVHVPSNWAVLGFEEPVYRGFSDKSRIGSCQDDKASEGLYIKRFLLPDTFADKRVLLHFGGVWNSAEVWLNGQRVGRHDSGYTSFSMDVTGIAHEGENTLAVRVRQVYHGYKTDTYDDWTLGGIYRDVTVEAMPKLRWIDRVTAVTTFDSHYRDAKLQLKMMVADDHKSTLPGNYRSPGKPYKLHVRLTAPDGETVSDETYECASHTASYCEQKKTLTVRNAEKWTAETPRLYSLSIELMEEGIITQTFEERIGLRQIEIKDGVLTLNGQAIKLRGVNRHDEWPTVGRATTREHWLKDLKLMKQANVNYVRAAHYQHAKGFIEMCDSIGMYVGAEVSLGGAGKLMYDPSFVAPVMLRAYETVMRDLNNPSVIYWSVGNEDPLTDLHLQAVKTVKALDSTRPVCLPWNAHETLPEEVDILAPHYWTAHEYDSIAAQSKRPIITTEYVHAYGEMRFGGLEDCFRALTRHPAGAGGAVWMWADQGIYTPVPKDTKRYNSIEKDSLYLRIDAQGWDGITDSYRHPTRDFWEVKSVYCPIYPVSASLSEDHSSADVVLRNDYDFLNADDILIYYKVFVDGKQVGKGKGTLDAQPHGKGTMHIGKTGLRQLKPGQTAYLQMSIQNGDGHEMGQKSIVLSEANYALKDSPQKGGVLAVAESDESITVSAGSRRFVFSRKSGMPQGMRPTFWHKLNEGDITGKTRINGEEYSTQVKQMTCDRKAENVIVTTEATWVIDDSNRIDGTYTFCITPQGNMTVSYTMTPQVAVRFLPLVGTAVETQPKQWFGLGPEDAYPNKKSAPILGLYDARQWSGTRAARWIDTAMGRIVLKPSVGDYGYIDRDAPDSKWVRIVSHVQGRSEKGRLNDKRYHITSDSTYSGSFVIFARR